MRRLNLDLVVIMILTDLVLFLTLFSIEITWLRTLLSLPLALFGVGYVVGAALFPLPKFGKAERFLLSVGLSLSILILAGLLLHLLPVGLTPQSWAAILFLIITPATLLAISRRALSGRLPKPGESGLANRKAAISSYPGPGPDGSPVSPVTQPVPATLSEKRSIKGAPVLPREPAKQAPSQNWISNALRGTVFSLAALVVTLSIGLSLLPAPQAPYQGYSMFWMTPVQSSASPQAELGVRSMEFKPQSYRVELYDGGKLVQQWDNIHLAPKQEWTLHLDLGNYQQGNGSLEALLYRLDQPGAPYRQVWLRQPLG